MFSSSIEGFLEMLRSNKDLYGFFDWVYEVIWLLITEKWERYKETLLE